MKRAFDLLFSALVLVFLLPILSLLAIVVYFRLGSPILFAQERPGYGGKPFTIYKFRTLKDSRDNSGNLLPDAERIDRFGSLLRSTSLDELPELWNVLMGDMSIVGPRPLLMEYLPLYSVQQARRHEVRPGITGWAQVRGRNSLGWDEKFQLDVWYVDNRTFILDLKIIWETIFTVLGRQGVTQEGHVTMERFRGNNNQDECR